MAALSVAPAPSVLPGFTFPQQARRGYAPKRVRHPTDWQFTSGCSPPHLTATQLPSITELRPAPAGTRTLLTRRPHGRTGAGILPIGARLRTISSVIPVLVTGTHVEQQGIRFRQR